MTEAEAITLKRVAREARKLIDRGWTKGTFYAAEGGDEIIEGQLQDVLADGVEIIAVCSVGAMRMALSQLLDTNDDAVIYHPLYREGMKILGRVFYESELLRNAAGDQQEKLLNGEGGRAYGPNDVAAAIIHANDDDITTSEAIEEAFARFEVLAPDVVPPDVVPA